jgi:ethanolamine utilization microcompartment shell protein EutS
LRDSVQLRTYVFLDNLQPQMAAYGAAIGNGFLPVEGEAALYVEVSPGMAIHRLTDVALKAVPVMPVVQEVERRYGTLALHSPSQADVRQAGQSILDALNRQESDRMAPQILAQEIIRRVDDHQAMLINREEDRGMMIMAQQTLFILEVAPAGYAVLAANEALKAADVNLVRVRATGAFGRVYLAGEEAEIMVAAQAAVKALAAVSGVPCNE